MMSRRASQLQSVTPIVFKAKIFNDKDVAKQITKSVTERKALMSLRNESSSALLAAIVQQMYREASQITEFTNTPTYELMMTS